jgi:hypothetical protein
VLVHSFSRFFRDSFQFEMHRRTLEKHNVSLISITQAVSEDPSGQMFRQLVAMFDEYQSRETAKHVLRAMKENARLGFWNGSSAPYGYKAVIVETRADAVKKKLEIDPVEAEVVREIFDLCRAGRGIRLIADHLNQKGLTYRRKGRKWTSGLVHQVLTFQAYAGTHYFNRTEAKRKRRKEKAEWVAFETPVIIDPEVFQAVQRLLEARRPTRTAPRIVTGPTLLTGLVRCATCGGGMTIRTGKGGRYRYYTCNNRVNEGPSSCKGRNIPMPVLDSLVLENLEARILAPERLEALLRGLLDRARNKTEVNAVKAKELRKKLRDTEGKIERLLNALAGGTVDDTAMFRRSMAQLEAERDEVLRMIAAMEKHREVPRHLLTKRNIERFATAARTRLRDDSASLRKRYMRQLVSRIEVGDRQIRISGPHSGLAEGVLDSGSDPAAGVPSFVQDWWWKQSISNRSLQDDSLLTGKRTGNVRVSWLLERWK